MIYREYAPAGKISGRLYTYQQQLREKKREKQDMNNLDIVHILQEDIEHIEERIDKEIVRVDNRDVRRELRHCFPTPFGAILYPEEHITI